MGPFLPFSEAGLSLAWIFSQVSGTGLSSPSAARPISRPVVRSSELSAGDALPALSKLPGPVPVVKRLLPAPCGLDGIPGLGFPDQGFGLANFHSFGQKLLAQENHFLFGGFDPGRQHLSQALRADGLLEACEAVCKLARVDACLGQAPPPARTLDSTCQSPFQPGQPALSGFQRQVALFLLK